MASKIKPKSVPKTRWEMHPATVKRANVNKILVYYAINSFNGLLFVANICVTD